MDYDPNRRRYPSRRALAYGGRGMVCAPTPLAAQAGLDMLKAGGSAADAAVAAAMALTVLEPISNGVGSDAFALVWSGGKLHGLNASGYAPARLTAPLLRRRGLAAMPRRGWETVTVPGAPAAWAALNRRFGALPLTALAQPAVRYAREGYPVSPGVAAQWQGDCAGLERELEGPLFRPWFDTFCPPPAPGARWACPDLAATLEEIAATGAESFYRGALAGRLLDWSARTGGYLEGPDLADYTPEWVEPLSTDYRGYRVYEMPPNCQGAAVLMALNLLRELELGPDRDSPETWHAMIESVKLSLSDARAYLADPRAMRLGVEALLSRDYARRRAALIRPGQALLPAPGRPEGCDTVYLCAADGAGNMVSYIQSNYYDFGSAVVVPGTGILLQSRGNAFSLDAGSPNCLAGRRRSFHTVLPGFLCRDGVPVGPFGLVGGPMQPQGHVQLLVGALDYGLNPQECLDAPRFQWLGGRRVLADPGAPAPLLRALEGLGHEISVPDGGDAMGRGAILWHAGAGALVGAADPRGDGAVAAW